jgi:formyltetrahydrofolate synthetase
LDPTVYKDWQIAEEAEKSMPTPRQWQEKLGLMDDEIFHYGKVAKLNYAALMERLADRPNGKYIEVTAITPTPLGEGKSTTAIGLIQGLGHLGLNVGGCLRQPSGGPTMNVKGSAAGGGNALLIPMTEFSLGLTGDMNDIANAHNLAMVALNARMQHEYNYNDETLAAKNLRRLDIDAKRVQVGWVIDFSAQCLRDIIIGMGGKQDGFTMTSHFDITASSELMAILAISTDLADMRRRIGEIILAYDKNGNPVTAEDLEVAGAMAAWMRNTINPTLCSTLEGQPCFIHAGPFANIAIGQSSIISDKLALKMFDYNVTESGFGADVGFEKFVDVKCRLSGLVPDVSVLVATIRALKMHGGGSKVVSGNPLPAEYRENNPQLVEAGLPNLLHHLHVIQRTGVHPIVCLNSFATDTPEEIAVVRRAVEGLGMRFAISEHWQRGGKGALQLARMVKEACDEPHDFHPLYDHRASFMEKVDIIAKDVYGADSVNWLPVAERKISEIENNPAFADFDIMMVKTQLSLSHDPSLKGVPRGWRLPISDVLIYGGAHFICPVSGDIRLMPGTASNPAYRRIDIDTGTGKVKGLF